MTVLSQVQVFNNLYRSTKNQPYFDVNGVKAETVIPVKTDSNIQILLRFLCCKKKKGTGTGKTLSNRYNATQENNIKLALQALRYLSRVVLKTRCL